MSSIAMLAALATAAAQPNLPSALSAAVGAINASGKRQCVEESLRPTRQSELEEILALGRIKDADRVALTNELDRPSSGQDFTIEARTRLSMGGWRLVDRKAKRNLEECDLLVRLSNPILTQNFGVVGVSFTKPGTNAFYNFTVLLGRAEYGWRTIATTDETILVI